MKNLFTKVASLMMLVATMSLVLVSCSSDDEITLLEGVTVTIGYDSSQFNETAYAGETVSLVNVSTQGTYTAVTDAAGKATFVGVIPGVYSMTVSHEATAAEKANMKNNPGANAVMITGNLSDFAVYAEGASASITMQSGVISSLVIAKFYTNGVKDDLDKSYRYDYYYTIYNNSAEAVDLSNKYVGIADQYSTNPFADDKENNVYMELIIPMGAGSLAPGASRVFTAQAIDHTANASKSVDLSGADYEVREVPNTILDRSAPESADVPNLAVSWATFSNLNYLGINKYSRGGMNIVIFESDNVDALEERVADPTKTNKQYFKKVSTSSVLDGVAYTKYKVTDGVVDTEYMNKYRRLPEFIDTFCYLEENATYLGIAFTRKVKETVEGREVLVDTNQSSEDFATTTVLDPRDFTVTPYVAP